MPNADEGAGGTTLGAVAEVPTMNTRAKENTQACQKGCALDGLVFRSRSSKLKELRKKLEILCKGIYEQQ